ncbi:MAG: hypothetical protein MZV64_72465 [Ignavibacteriales bacterium]|nr:hypothetical protein [Ignavibacteriales bacterium]
MKPGAGLIVLVSGSKQIAIYKMLLIRIATETLQQSLPGGAVYAELVRPYLLKKHLEF